MKATLRGVLFAAFVLVMCGVCVRLGFWQLDRLKQRKARNRAEAAALALPPLAYDSATAAAIARAPARFVGRRIHASGIYQPDGEIILRGRANDGNPGVHLVTPLLVADVPQALLVNRGWVPSPDAATVDTHPYVEAGDRAVDGVLMEIPRNTTRAGEPTTQVVHGQPVTTYHRLDLDVVRRIERRPVLPLYVQQLPGSDSAAARPPIRVALEPMNNGPHLSYAIQWFSFATIGVIGLVVMYLRRKRDETMPDARP
jgi:surfeit locus 1 family protein